MTAAGFFYAHGEPAAGAPTEDLIPAALVAAFLGIGLVAFAFAHLTGRTKVLIRLGDFAERVSGLPGWAAVPAAITAVALLTAAFGFYWDVATHIDDGRDPGPFANPAHFLIIAGLCGIALAGFVSVLLASTQPDSAAKASGLVRIRSDWYAPVGGLLLLLCGGIAVIGFPLDDVWHRLFGQDVTLWSPTHMQMVGGAALSTLALWMLLVEADRASGESGRVPRFLRLHEAFVAGAVLIGLSAFQAEFDYSVPQFRLLYHPVLLALTAGTVLVAARVRLGRGGALKTVAFFLLLRGIVSLLVGPVLDHTTLHFPLYLIEALVVEIVAARMGTSRQVTFGAAAGAAIGSVGLAAEWGWSHLWMTIAWPPALLPEAIILGLLAGVAGGALGGLIGRALLPAESPRQGVPRPFQVAMAAGVLLALFYPFPTNAELDGSATMSLSETTQTQGRWVDARISLEPNDLAEDAEWFNVTSWQGGGSVVTEPEKVGPGEYRLSVPIPVYGEWKSLVRLQRGRSLMALPIFMPEDRAIPAPEIPARDQFTRDFVSDKELVLREAKEVEGSLIYGSLSAMVTIALLWVTAMGWGLRRLDGASLPADRRGPARRRATPRTVG
ncbi:MAG: hypothetical protein M3280_12325 [Actinomycetota bacterium]|nr:hypothetical protein [Actinomycetota bacterium]